MSGIDPTTLAVVRGRLEQTTDEMDTVFERMAFSPVISDAWDRATGLDRPDEGSMIVQGERGLPIFVGTMQFATRAVIDSVEAPRSGDVFIINDPYLGGTHVMDVKMVRPFFYGGELLCYLANTGHWTDVGGRVPGGFSSAATEVYQEGLRFPPVRLFSDDLAQRRHTGHPAGQQPHTGRHRRRRPRPGGRPAGRRGAAPASCSTSTEGRPCWSASTSSRSGPSSR